MRYSLVFFPSVITGDCPTPSGLPWALSDIVNSKITTNIIVGGCFVRVDFSTVINATAGAGGQVSPASRTVMSPSNPTFTLTPDAGFSVGTMGGTCSGSLAGNTYTAFVRGVQCTVIANFNAAVTATAGAGGSISPPSAGVPQGATQNFTVSPNAGFVVGTVSGCAGTFVPATSVYTTGPITGPCAVAATFLANINGVCGSASGTTGVAVAPSANLCATGTATLVAANANNFTWGCNGSNGGYLHC